MTVFCCFQDRNEAAGVFSYMTGRMIDEACSLAISNGDLHLALLVSQAIGSDDSRQLMRHQLGAWSQTEVAILNTAKYHLIILLSSFSLCILS